MAVTFPSKDLFIQLRRPSAWPSDPTQEWEKLAADNPSAHVVELNGATPAIVLDEDSDSTRADYGYYGAVTFVKDGTEIRVHGHTDDATLEAIAQSLLAQWPSPSSPDSQCPGPKPSPGPTGVNGPTS